MCGWSLVCPCSLLLSSYCKSEETPTKSSCELFSLLCEFASLHIVTSTAYYTSKPKLPSQSRDILLFHSIRGESSRDFGIRSWIPIPMVWNGKQRDNLLAGACWNPLCCTNQMTHEGSYFYCTGAANPESIEAPSDRWTQETDGEKFADFISTLPAGRKRYKKSRSS